MLCSAQRKLVAVGRRIEARTHHHRWRGVHRGSRARKAVSHPPSPSAGDLGRQAQVVPAGQDHRRERAKDLAHELRCTSCIHRAQRLDPLSGVRWNLSAVERREQTRAEIAWVRDVRGDPRERRTVGERYHWYVSPVAAGVSGARSEEAGDFFERSAQRERRRSDGDLGGAMERSRSGLCRP